MKIAGSHTLSTDPQRAYALLQDPEVLAKCMPGAESLTRVGPDEYEMKMKMAISSIQGLFAGKIRIADQNPPQSFRLMVEGTGKVGFMKGDGLLNLAPQDGGTQISYEGDVQVGGLIAGVGQRLIDTTAKYVIRKFFERFTEEAGRLESAPTPA